MWRAVLVGAGAFSGPNRLLGIQCPVIEDPCNAERQFSLKRDGPMTHLSHDKLQELISSPKPPCLSIYLPTHRHFPDNQRDPIAFKNLLREVEDSLKQRFGSRDIRPFVEPLRSLASDSHFWNHTLDGLAIFVDSDRQEIFPLQRSVPQFADVSNRFYVKPLLRYLQSSDRFQVVCLSRSRASIWEGNRYVVDAIEAEGFPMTIEDVLGAELTEPHLTVAGYGKGVGGTPMYHGHGSRKDETEIDDERFFRAIDRLVLERFSKPSGLPLILVGLPKHQAVFRSVSQNKWLISEGVSGDPESYSPDELRKSIWELLEPRYRTRLADLTDQFHTAFNQHLGSGDLSDVARATVTGRVATLMVDADEKRPGQIDVATGAIHPDDLAKPDVGDMLDDLAELVVARGGEVVVVPHDRMPTQSGLAAIFRYY